LFILEGFYIVNWISNKDEVSCIAKHLFIS